jgi:hypothetical protein
LLRFLRVSLPRSLQLFPSPARFPVKKRGALFFGS